MSTVAKLRERTIDKLDETRTNADDPIDNPAKMAKM